MSMLLILCLALAVWLVLNTCRATPTFIPGYGGTITCAGATLYMAEWDFGFEIKLLSYDTFSKTASLGYYFENYIAGLATGDITFKGFWDNTAAQMPSGPTLLLRPGQKPNITLTYDGSVGYGVTGIIKKINPKSSAEGTSDFNFDYKILSVANFSNQT